MTLQQCNTSQCIKIKETEEAETIQESNLEHRSRKGIILLKSGLQNKD